MNGWTKKRKVDTFMGILLQVYCFFPWMRINRKWNTIHMYVIKTFQENDYIKMYNHTFLKQHMWKWKHSQVVAFIFLLMLIFLILLQSIELYELYQCIKNGNQSTNYHVFVWITYLAAFYIFMAIASTGFAAFYSMPMFCYMMLFLAVIGIWIFLDIQAEAWDVETGQHRAELEEQDKKMLQMKVKAMEEQYREMLKSRKIVHDMKNHLLALKKYTQEQDWKGLEEYLNELSRDMLDYNYQIWTGNHMLDMILNQKEKEAEKQKTQMQIKEGERWIHIKMKKKNQLLYIEIVNAAKNMGIQTDENFVSKKDGVLHGYGMKNIRDIVEQYNGMFQCKSQEDRFEVVITIYG